jgi:hypothetical protein
VRAKFAAIRGFYGVSLQVLTFEAPSGRFDVGQVHDAITDGFPPVALGAGVGILLRCLHDLADYATVIG